MTLSQTRKKFEREGIRYSHSGNELAFALAGAFVIRQGDRHSNTCIACQYVRGEQSSSFEFNRIEISDSFIYFCMGDVKFNVTR